MTNELVIGKEYVCTESSVKGIYTYMGPETGTVDSDTVSWLLFQNHDGLSYWDFPSRAVKYIALDSLSPMEQEMLRIASE